jgi:MFS family permease
MSFRGSAPAAETQSAPRPPLWPTRGALAAIATMVAAGAGASLLPPLVALNLADRGVSERTIGLLIASVAAAALGTAPFAARLAARAGTARALIAAAGVAAALFPALFFVRSIPALFALLAVFGAAITVSFTLAEYWINAATPNHRRGYVIGIYATMLSLGLASGPAIIAALGHATLRPFLAGAAVMATAAVPAWLARRLSPDFARASPRRFSVFLLAVPTATLGALAFGMSEQGGFGFLPLWGRHLGFEPEAAVLLASAMTLGNLVFQIPLGLLGDRIDRRLVLVGCGVVGALGMGAAWLVAASYPLLVAVLVVWGGATAGLYTVGLAHLASRFSGADLAGANAAFVFCYALGMLVGPATIGDAMARAPVGGFPLVLGLVFAFYAVIAAVEARR